MKDIQISPQSRYRFHICCSVRINGLCLSFSPLINWGNRLTGQLGIIVHRKHLIRNSNGVFNSWMLLIGIKQKLSPLHSQHLGFNCMLFSFQTELYDGVHQVSNHPSCGKKSFHPRSGFVWFPTTWRMGNPIRRLVVSFRGREKTVYN